MFGKVWQFQRWFLVRPLFTTLRFFVPFQRKNGVKQVQNIRLTSFVTLPSRYSISQQSVNTLEVKFLEVESFCRQGGFNFKDFNGMLTLRWWFRSLKALEAIGVGVKMVWEWPMRIHLGFLRNSYLGFWFSHSNVQVIQIGSFRI